MKILAIGAHPDDLEIGCFGTLKKLKDNGNDVEIVITTYGGYKSVEMSRSRNWDDITSEAEKSAGMLSAPIVFFDNPVLNLQINGDSIRKLDQKIGSGNYDLIITHSPNDHHQDHRVTWDIVRAATRRYEGKIWQMELSLYTYKSKSFIPNIFVDISNSWDFKVRCLNCYKSYITPDIIKGIKALAQFRSQAITSADYVESFCQVQEIIK